MSRQPSPSSAASCLFGLLVSLLTVGCASRVERPPAASGQLADSTPPDAQIAAPAPAQGGRRLELPTFAAQDAGLVTAASTPPRCTGIRRGAPAVLCVAAGAEAAEQARGTTRAPFATIKTAIEAAKSGDRIHVGQGQFPENLLISGKTLAVFGGFAPGFERRQPAVFVSTIAVQRGAAISLLDAATSRIDGFRIRGGTGSERQSKFYYQGGGIYIRGGQPTVAHNIVEDNDVYSTHRQRRVDKLGGGLSSERARVKIIGNWFRRNRADRGGGLSLAGDALLANNRISGNLALGNHGGGIYACCGRIELRGNLIEGNRVDQADGGWGGGAALYGKATRGVLSMNRWTGNTVVGPGAGSALLIDDGARAELGRELIVNNSCGGGDAVLFVDGDGALGSQAQLNNVTIADNPCTARGVAVRAEQHSRVHVANSILWNNGGADLQADRSSRVAVRYSVTQARVAGRGNRRVDPLLVAADGYRLRSAAGRWSVATGRWVRDAQTSVAIDAADPKGGLGQESEPHGGRRNLGAFGGTAGASRSPRSGVP